MPFFFLYYFVNYELSRLFVNKFIVKKYILFLILLQLNLNIIITPIIFFFECYGGNTKNLRRAFNIKKGL